MALPVTLGQWALMANGHRHREGAFGPERPRLAAINRGRAHREYRTGTWRAGDGATTTTAGGRRWVVHDGCALPWIVVGGVVGGASDYAWVGNFDLSKNRKAARRIAVGVVEREKDGAASDIELVNVPGENSGAPKRGPIWIETQSKPRFAASTVRLYDVTR